MPKITIDGFSTWFECISPANPAPDLPPLLVVHGGPGARHDYLRGLSVLSDSGRTIVFYDQLGNGRSQRLSIDSPTFWTVELLKRQLEELARYLFPTSEYHLFGHSFGGCLAQELAITQPNNIRSLVLADSVASIDTYVREVQILIEDLPGNVADDLRQIESTQDWANPKYLAASMEFYRRYVCRLDPWPQLLLDSFDPPDDDPTVYRVMNGPSDFTVTGTIRGWSSLDRLQELNVPTLLMSGRYDEATPACQRELQEAIAGSRWEIFENSSHVPHLEEPAEFLRVLNTWLQQHD